MRVWLVELPMTGIVSFEVVAETEEEAIEKSVNSDWSEDDIVEMQTHHRITQGNFFYGLMNEPRVQDQGKAEPVDMEILK